MVHTSFPMFAHSRTLACAALMALAASPLLARELPPLAQPTLPGGVGRPGIVAPDTTKTRQISAHIWWVPGFPNVPIIVGRTGVLVVDTGLGNAAGRIVAAEAQRLAPGRRLYLTTTHFHPEHASGAGGFPAGTVLLRPRVQQDELALDQGRLLARFRAANPELLAEADYGTPQLFATQRVLDLGGVSARVFWAGPAHTYGDTLVFVPQDGALISGDVVQNHTTPTFLGGGIGPDDWLKTLAPIALLRPRLVIPDHSDPGPGVAMIAAERTFLETLIAQAQAARAAGLSEDAAVEQVMAGLHARFPDWSLNPLTADGVRRAYRKPKE